MSGHSKWSQIKHRKGIADQKRGQIFSKLLNAVAIAARRDPNPEYNPRLRAAIEKAKDANVPNESIGRAVKRAKEIGQNLEELTLGAYGPGSAAILIEAITNSKNRTISETKSILNKLDAKWAEPGSVQWAFKQTQEAGGIEWKARFPQNLSREDNQKLKTLIEALENHPDIQKVYTNANSNS